MNRSFGIRPLSNNIRPGDDIQLKISLYKTTDPACAAVCSAVVDEKYYLAVYDKKMLWRANLYIDDGAEKDWNNQIVHQWNAPADAASAKTGRWPKWWDVSYGYNEWNRSCNGIVSYDDISSLQVGNGKQVLNFVGYTPVKKVGSERTDNIIWNRVSYSYPYEWLDGHFDGPFDFKKS